MSLSSIEMEQCNRRKWIILSCTPEYHLRWEYLKQLFYEIEGSIEESIKENSLSNRELETFSIIDKDVTRSLPMAVARDRKLRDPEYGEPFQNRLRRILRVYSRYDEEVAYVQGMNFIVTTLCVFFADDAECFAIFVRLMHGKDYSLRGLYLQDFPDIEIYSYILKNLIREHLPRLADHLEETDISPDNFFEYYFTLFTLVIPPDQIHECWELIFADQWTAVFRIMMALLQHLEPYLLGRDFQGTICILKGYQRARQDIDALEMRNAGFLVEEPASRSDEAVLDDDGDDDDDAEATAPTMARSPLHRVALFARSGRRGEFESAADNAIETVGRVAGNIGNWARSVFDRGFQPTSSTSGPRTGSVREMAETTAEHQGARSSSATSFSPSSPSIPSSTSPDTNIGSDSAAAGAADEHSETENEGVEENVEGRFGEAGATAGAGAMADADASIASNIVFSGINRAAQSASAEERERIYKATLMEVKHCIQKSVTQAVKDAQKLAKELAKVPPPSQAAPEPRTDSRYSANLSSSPKIPPIDHTSLEESRFRILPPKDLVHCALSFNITHAHVFNLKNQALEIKADREARVKEELELKRALEASRLEAEAHQRMLATEMGQESYSGSAYDVVSQDGNASQNRPPGVPSSSGSWVDVNTDELL